MTQLHIDFRGFSPGFSPILEVTAVDGSEIRRSPPDMYETLVNIGINYQPQLLSRISSINSVVSFKSLRKLNPIIQTAQSQIYQLIWMALPEKSMKPMQQLVVFSHPSEKHDRQFGSSPQGSG